VNYLVAWPLQVAGRLFVDIHFPEIAEPSDRYIANASSGLTAYF